MCIIVGNEPKYCACLCVNNVLYVYNCIHEKAIKPSCILYLVSKPLCPIDTRVANNRERKHQFGHSNLFLHITYPPKPPQTINRK